MSTIVLHIEDKVSTCLLVAFMRLTFTHIFVGVVIMHLVCFKLDTVSPEIVTVFLSMLTEYS